MQGRDSLISLPEGSGVQKDAIQLKQRVLRGPVSALAAAPSNGCGAHADTAPRRDRILTRL
jgi:hypothetical protein